MGCKQTTTKTPPVVIATSPTTPNYVKSALKKSHVKEGGKTEKLSHLKQKVSTSHKSVNFDEKVRVKSRTPTPRERRYERTPSTKNLQRQIYTDDKDVYDHDIDDDVRSISSQDDIINEPIKKSKPVYSQASLRNQSNALWHKNNAIGIIPTRNTIKEKNKPLSTAIPQLPLNVTTDSTEDPNLPIGNRFRVRRKVQYPVIPQASSPVVPIQSPPASSSPSNLHITSHPVQRPLPSTNAILIEHHASFSNGGSTPKTGYYAFARQPTGKTNPTER
ncbi:unnamed protein product [Rotaria magnacalcarata]|uniref:Uncharacterized protein n=1 Tax=Rotaria magnacalcarata TaxID=392030 RepID=A0A819BAQ2_9BILA|nr:unnamed protein product [Rotaria magnacalcarata]CAF1971472.1 unnamed protein product [Rotaria magnacalcarata]CAF2152446.1 unnamed protein product [Rotaria magnacalcarata]CAF3798920.1 unnamed protein product [Rotaria magnacalcarata]